MPLLGFTKLKDKLLDGSKTQTIRKPRKNPLKVGDILFIYWKLRTKQCEKLGEAIVTRIICKEISDFTHEDAVKDGFKNLEELDQAFEEMHKDFCSWTEFNIITFRWTLKLWEKKA